VPVEHSTVAEQVSKGAGRWHSNGWLASVLYPLSSLLGLLLIWQAVVAGFAIKPFILPSPRLVFDVIREHYAVLFRHTLVTSFETLVGFSLSVFIGIPIAIAIVASRRVEEFIYPVLVASQTIPKVAIAPLFIVWLGFGFLPKIVIAWLIAFFPVVIATVIGLKSTPIEMIYLGRIAGLSWWQMFVKISFPRALPEIFGGLKVAMTLAVVGAIVGEFVGASEGLGYLLMFATAQMQTALVFAALLFLVGVGIIFFGLVQFAERLAIPWHVSMRREELPLGPA
jgi:NitT/TauT family transport system permease protein